MRKYRKVYPDVFYRDIDLSGGGWETGASTTTGAQITDIVFTLIAGHGSFRDLNKLMPYLYN
jgi:hypothetical protein